MCGHLNVSHLGFTSPSYPYSYRVNTECVWTLNVSHLGNILSIIKLYNNGFLINAECVWTFNLFYLGNILSIIEFYPSPDHPNSYPVNTECVPTLIVSHLSSLLSIIELNECSLFGQFQMLSLINMRTLFDTIEGIGNCFTTHS